MTLTDKDKASITRSDVKIVRLAGQQFRFAYTVENEAIRNHYASQYPEVVAATIEESTHKEGDDVFLVVSFLKKAGQKGSDALTVADLATILRRLPVAALPLKALLKRDVRDLTLGYLTFNEAIVVAKREIGNATTYTNHPKPVTNVEVKWFTDAVVQVIPCPADELPSGW